MEVHRDEAEGSDGAAMVESESHGAEVVVDDSDEVQFVFNSLAADAQVPDSFAGVTMSACEDAVFMDVAHALLLLQSTKVSTFDLDKTAQEGLVLMLPAMLPHLYGDENQDINDAGTDLLWINHGYVHYVS